MANEDLKREVMAALAAVRDPAGGTDLVAAGKVRNLEVGEEGDVRFSFFLSPDDPGSLVKEARAAVEEIDAVASVKVNVQLPQTGVSAPGGTGEAGSGPSGPAHAAPGRGGGGGLKPGSVPAPTPQPDLLPDVGRIVAVSSGKGGVGKSMVAANVAAALAGDGLRVGLLDADIYGPNIPRMFGEERRPRVTGERGREMIEPLEAHGVRLMSLGFLLEKEQPAIMRGPLISGILKQFLEQVEWGPLDVMVVDMPPGTGDAQLSLVQTIDLDGAVMVSTPQPVATGDVLRGIKMFERVNTRVLGIVENMSGYACPHCGESTDVFGRGGAEALSEETGVPFLGRIPLDPAVREAGDEGVPTVIGAPESGAGRALREIARALEKALEPAAAAGA